MLRGVDARFLLPLVPARACVLPGAATFADGLVEAGVEIVEPGQNLEGQGLDLVVAASAEVDEALALEARSFLFLGRPVASRARARGLAAEVYLAVPKVTTASFLVPLGRPEPLRYLYRRLRVAPSLSRWWRSRVVAEALSRGFPPPFGSTLTVVAPGTVRPATLAATEELVGPADDGWLLSLGPVHDEGRLVFLVFDGEAPRYAVKCDRRAGPWPEAPSTGAAFLAEAVAASPLVASHVPRPVGSTRLDDRLLEVETAGVGFLLTTFLRGPFARDDKLVAIEAVAAWLLELAECSARPVDAEAEDATEELADIPRVLCHGDLWSSNVIIDTDGRFQVVDWADVQPLGLPLGDLLVFLSESLSELDGEDTDEGRDQHFVELLTGHHRSSPLLFVWVRAMVEALRIDPARVGAVAEAALVRMAEHRLGLAGLAPEQLYRDPRVLVGDPVVRRARLWTTTPGLGRDWQAWRVPASGPSGPSEPTEPLAGTKGGLRRMARRGERRVGHSARSLVDLIGRDCSDELGQGRVLVLAPHPDDETLACGGVLACHADSDSAFVIVASDGSHGAYGVDPQVLAARRRQELAAATDALGLPSDRVTWWGYEDGTLRWRVDEIVARLEEAFDQLEPAFVLSPWALDVHPDHAALGRAARIAAADRPLELLEYVVWAWDRPSALVRAGSGSTSHEPAHGGRWLPAGRPVVFKDAHAREAKRTALSCYGSQIGGLGSGTARGEASLDRAMVELFVSGNELFWPAPRQPRHAGRGWPG